MTVSPFDHPYLSGLLGDDETAGHFSVQAEIAAMLAFERALAEAEADEIGAEAAAGDRCGAGLVSSPTWQRSRPAVARDGVVVPELVRQLRDGCRRAAWRKRAFRRHQPGRHRHRRWCCGLKPVLDRLDALLAQLVAALAELDGRFGSQRPDGPHAHAGGHRRSPSPTASAPGASRSNGTARALQRCGPSFWSSSSAVRPARWKSLATKAASVRSALAEKLGLGDAPQWQSQRDRLADFASLLSLITGSLGKFGQDVALMAQAGDEIALAGGGGSSAMPHKQNPVAAEVLVTLARFNATQLSGMHQALVHEQERSGAAWTLEWLLLPQMAVAAAASLRQANALAAQITSIGARPGT